MSSFKTLDALADDMAAGSIVLIRADLNVPLDDNGAVRDATRLERLLPSLKKLSQNGFRIGVLSHFGRPKGQRVAEMSLASIAVPPLTRLLRSTRVDGAAAGARRSAGRHRGRRFAHATRLELHRD